MTPPHLLVDTLGLICKAHVTTADTSDRDGAAELLGRLDRRRFPRLRHGWADQGYRGPFLRSKVMGAWLGRAAAERGIGRIRGSPHLAFSFLRHCGLSLW